MKIKLILIVFVGLVAANATFAQPGKKGGSGPGAQSQSATGSAGSSGSGTNQLIQGFHYKLKAFHHVRYKQVKPGKMGNLPAGTQAAVNTVDQFIDYKIVKRQPTDPAIAPSGVKYINKDYKVTDINTGTHNSGSANFDRQDQRDSLWRYTRQKLWMSVIQADSGKLLVQFYNGQEAQNVQKALIDGSDLNNIHFVQYKDSSFNVAIPIKPTDSAQNFYYTVKNKLLVQNPTYYISLPYAVYQYGATLIPFRVRFGNGSKTSVKDASNTYTYSTPTESSSNLSLATYIGRKWGRSRFYYDATKSHNTVAFMLAAFGGFTSVSLSANNLSAIDINTPSDVNKYPSSMLAYSTGVAATLELGSFNLGLFTGVDVPLQHTKWVYSDRPWIGFGIGFNLGMLNSTGSIGL